jgi:hypothetical protein
MLLAHAGGALYGTGLGLVTLKRIGFFCFPIIDSNRKLPNGKQPKRFDRTFKTCCGLHSPAMMRGLLLARVWDSDLASCLQACPSSRSKYGRMLAGDPIKDQFET